jgi:putative autoinducer-2 (AI-2) aldolase
MGRNIFQADAPVPMMKAVRGVVHEGMSASDAFELYEQLKSEEVS